MAGNLTAPVISDRDLVALFVWSIHSSLGEVTSPSAMMRSPRVPTVTSNNDRCVMYKRRGLSEDDSFRSQAEAPPRSSRMNASHSPFDDIEGCCPSNVVSDIWLELVSTR